VPLTKNMRVIRQPFSWLFILVLLVFVSAACSPSPVILPINDSRAINNGSSFGQSFTAQNDGLSGVSILLGPSSNQASGSLLFHLRTDSQSQDDIAVARLSLSEVTRKDYYKFDFPPQTDSQGKDYFLDVQVEDGGEVEIFTAKPDSYLDGALYENQVPQDAQLGFRLEYNQKIYLLGLTRMAIQWIYALGVGLFAYVIPGWAIFTIFWRGWDTQIWPVKVGLATGLSIAIYPVLFLWTNLIGLHLGSLYAWLPLIIGLLAIGWKNRRFFYQFKKPNLKEIIVQHDDITARTQIVLADIAFLIILGLIIISRFWVIRSIDIPLFGDSYQHTMITQLIIDHGGLFDSWEPYADLTTFTYHFGFHSAVAVFHWISGTSVEQAMLWTGQLINILAILALYPLAFKITKRRWAGVIAILVAGLLSPMPMSYVNWGRYTQLAGQVILPAAIWTAWSLLDRPKCVDRNPSFVSKLIDWRYLSLDFRNLTVAWLALGGLALTHYRILILVILFYPAYIFLTFSFKTLTTVLGRIVWIGTGGIVLFAPWFIHVFSGKILKIFAVQITTIPSTISSSLEIFSGIGDLRAYLPRFIWIVFVICLVWGIWNRNKNFAIFSLWWLFIILATNPNWLGLPGLGAITNFTIFIAFYIPASVIIGSAAEWIPQIIRRMENIDRFINKSKITALAFSCLVLIVICALGLWGLPRRIKDLNIPTYALVTRPDLRAMEWIRANTDTGSRFLINSFSAYGDSSIVGSDAGWWLPLLTLRQSSVPPLTYAAEQGITSDFGQMVNKLYFEIKGKGINNPDVLKLLKEQGINYIYIGQRQGSVNNPGLSLLDPTIINSDPHFQLIYHQDLVWIFKIAP
jgi:hypothetical protein